LVVDDDIPQIIKLHGDYKYDRLKNTEQELQELEDKIGNRFISSIQGGGLLVVGYSGNDDSVMDKLNELVSVDKKLPYGVIWCTPKGYDLSEKAKSFMKAACDNNNASCVVEIDDFDDLMYRLYVSEDNLNDEIENGWRQIENKQRIEFNNCVKYKGFVRTNSLQSNDMPTFWYKFKANITNWKELKSIINNKNIVAGLIKGSVVCFAKKDDIVNIFEGKITSPILKSEIPDYMFFRDNSVYVGMLYDLIGKSFLENGLQKFGKNKYYNMENSIKSESGLDYYDAIEVFLTLKQKKVVVTLLPTVYIESTGGNPIDESKKQIKINMYMSSIYNKTYNSKIKEWISRITLENKISFCIDKFQLYFNPITYSYGGSNRTKSWPLVNCFSVEEPVMQFDVDDTEQSSINQLKGLCNYGPVDISFKQESYRRALKLAILCPKNQLNIIINHLNRLKNNSIPKSDKDFLPPYSGFEAIFKRSIEIPSNNSSQCITYDGNKAIKFTPIEFYKGLTKYIDKITMDNPTIDVLVIYIPNSFAHLREVKNENTYFDLHDSLKVYCAGKNLIIQIIEERSAIVPEIILTTLPWNCNRRFHFK
jgi:hypothetical protein